MSKLGVIGTALRSNFTVRTFRASYGISDTWLLRQLPRRFSTEAEQPPQDSAVDSFLKTPDTGAHISTFDFGIFVIFKIIIIGLAFISFRVWVLGFAFKCSETLGFRREVLGYSTLFGC
jgi:hypothetical protein